MIKELPYRTKTICQNHRMRLRYTHYNSRSAARVSPRTHVIFALHKRPPKITTRPETYLYADETTIYCIAETMDLLTGNHTKQCSS